MWPAWMHCDCKLPVLLIFTCPNYQDAASQCPNCKQRNQVRCNKCKYCNADMKKRGRPIGTRKVPGTDSALMGDVLVRMTL